MAEEPRQRISIEDLVQSQRRNEEILQQIDKTLQRIERTQPSGFPEWVFNFWLIAGPICWLLSNASVPSSVAFGGFCMLILSLAVLSHRTAKPGPSESARTSPEDEATKAAIRGNVLVAAIIFGIVIVISIIVFGFAIAFSNK